MIYSPLGELFLNNTEFFSSFKEVLTPADNRTQP